MKKTISILAGAAGLMALSGCVEVAPAEPGVPSVGSKYDLSAFEGARAGQAEMGIMALGYEAVRYKGLTAFWLNRETGACARITTADGRYSNIKMLPTGDC